MTTKPYDPTLKELVELDPESWPLLLGRPTGTTTVIDSDIATVSGAADKVLRVSAAVAYLLHLEFVAGHDAALLPRKLHVRNGLLEDRHDLPVRSAAVLLHPQADSRQVTGVYERGFPGEESYLIFRYQVVRIWQLPPRPLLTGGLALLPLAPISAVTKDELPGIIKQIGQRLQGRHARKQAPVVWAATQLLLGLRYPLSLAAELLQGVTAMKESVTYQAIVEEGRNEGRNEGRKEGRNEGRTEGAVAEAQKLLRKLGAKAFGAPDAQTVAILDTIADLTRLEELCAGVLTATSWQELLDRPAPRRRRGRTQPS